MDKLGLSSPSADFNTNDRAISGISHIMLSSGLKAGYCPSPLDRIRSGQNDRRTQFGLSPTMSDSFEANQSFPKCSKMKLNIPSRKILLDDFKGKL